MKINDIKTNCNCGKNFRFCMENGTGDYLMVLFKSPCAVFTSSGYRNTPPMSMVVFDKNLRQEYYCSENDFIHDYIRFEPENSAENAILREIKMHSILTTAADETEPIFRLLAMEIYSNSVYRQHMSDMLINVLLTRAAEYSEASVTEHSLQTHRFIRLRSEIYSNPQSFSSAVAVAKELNISCSYFQFLYKKQFAPYFPTKIPRTLTLRQFLPTVSSQRSRYYVLHLVVTQTPNHRWSHCFNRSVLSFLQTRTRIFGFVPQGFPWP